MAFTPFTKDDRPTMANFNEKFQEAIGSSVEQALADGVKIETGSYEGTGTYGKNNPCSITFDFEPKIVVVSLDAEGLHPTIFTRNRNSAATWPSGITMGGYVSVFWEGNTLSWYIGAIGWNSASESMNVAEAARPSYQLNLQGLKYGYIAIG